MATEIEVLSDWIRTELGYKGELGADVDLLKERILDSFSVVQIAMFIQKRFEIELEAEDVVRANLSKLSTIVALIERRRTAVGSCGDEPVQ